MAGNPTFRASFVISVIKVVAAFDAKASLVANMAAQLELTKCEHPEKCRVNKSIDGKAWPDGVQW